MKKYSQISIILCIFFFLVIFRDLRSNNSNNGVIATPTGNLSPISAIPQSTPAVAYKDGTYTGNPTDAYYGNIQVQVTISNKRISDIQFLQYPNDNGTSIAINTQAMPLLTSEAIQAQSSSVDIVSGASDSSAAFQQSLSSALQKAS